MEKNLPRFTHGEFERKIFEHFAHNAKNPSALLKESCDHIKLHVLKAHQEQPDVVKWVTSRINKLIYFKPPGDVDEKQDIEQEFYTKLYEKTVPRKIENGGWIHHHKLEGYLRIALEGFRDNYLKRYYNEKKILNEIEHAEKIISSQHRKSYVELLLFHSLTNRQKKVMLLKGEGRTIEQIGDEIGLSEKTVDRDLKELRNNKELFDYLKEPD